MSRLQDVILYDTRANQPDAADVSIGTLYGVTDEGNIIERSNGTTWDPYSPSGGAPPSPAVQTSFLVSGGAIVWNANYVFDVAAATYFINGTAHASAATQVTLGAADPTNDRIDVIVVNDSDAVAVVAGTAAAQPVEPDIDPGSQLKLGFVIVEGGTTEPSTTVSELIYEDNAGSPAEWDWTASDASIDVNSTNELRNGTHTIEGTNVVSAAYAQGEIGSGSIDPLDYQYLIFWLKSKATWTNKRGLQVTLRSSGGIVGSAVTVERTGTWGFDSSNTTDYQVIAIPLSAFAVTAGLTFTQLRIADFGGAIGFYIADISLLGGAGVPSSQVGITLEEADARYLQPATADATYVALPITATLGIVIDGGGSAITTGVKGYLEVPVACTITQNTVLADQSGSIVIDIWKDTYANYPPTDADSITASAPPTISTAVKSQDSTLTGWTTAIAAGDVLGFNVDSATTVTRVTLQLTVTIP